MMSLFVSSRRVLFFAVLDIVYAHQAFLPRGFAADCCTGCSCGTAFSGTNSKSSYETDKEIVVHRSLPGKGARRSTVATANLVEEVRKKLLAMSRIDITPKSLKAGTKSPTTGASELSTAAGTGASTPYGEIGGGYDNPWPEVQSSSPITRSPATSDGRLFHGKFPLHRPPLIQSIRPAAMQVDEARDVEEREAYLADRRSLAAISNWHTAMLPDDDYIVDYFPREPTNHNFNMRTAMLPEESDGVESPRKPGHNWRTAMLPDTGPEPNYLPFEYEMELGEHTGPVERAVARNRDSENSTSSLVKNPMHATTKPDKKESGEVSLREIELQQVKVKPFEKIKPVQHEAKVEEKPFLAMPIKQELTTLVHKGILEVESLQVNATLSGAKWDPGASLELVRNDEEEYCGAVLRDPLLLSETTIEGVSGNNNIDESQKERQIAIDIFGGSELDKQMVSCSLPLPSSASSDSLVHGYCKGLGFRGKAGLAAIGAMGKTLDIYLDRSKGEFHVRIFPATVKDMTKLKSVANSFGIKASDPQKLKFVVNYPSDFAEQSLKKTKRSGWFSDPDPHPNETGISKIVLISAVI